MPDFSRNDFFWIFIIIALLILVAQIFSSIILYTSISKIPSELDKRIERVDNLANKLDSNLNLLQGVNDKISNIENNVITLSTKYPPEQTININNMNQNDLNRAINNAIDLKFEGISNKIEFNFIFNIIIGSLIGISFVYYFIFRRKG